MQKEKVINAIYKELKKNIEEWPEIDDEAAEGILGEIESSGHLWETFLTDAMGFMMLSGMKATLTNELKKTADAGFAHEDVYTDEDGEEYTVEEMIEALTTNAALGYDYVRTTVEDAHIDYFVTKLCGIMDNLKESNNEKYENVKTWIYGKAGMSPTAATIVEALGFILIVHEEDPEEFLTQLKHIFNISVDEIGEVK